MPDGGLKNYDYQVLDSCIAQMKAKVAHIEQQAGDLANQTRQLMANVWSGETANSYNTMSNKLDQALIQNSQNLDSLKQTVLQGVDHMHQTDRSGSRHFA